MEKIRKLDYQKVIICLFFMMTGSLLIYRAFHGMDITDETFYLATAKRFCNGDMLFKDDWNSGQLFGLILVPFYKIYVGIKGNSEGIILFSRIFFVLLELFVAFFLFRILRYNGTELQAALIVSFCVLCYTRGNIITVSYYSLSFLTFLLSILWWMEADKCKRKIYFILSGINYAITVLCMPYMAILFVGILFFLGYNINKKNSSNSIAVIWFSVGVIITAVLFVIFFFEIIPWTQIMEYFPLIFQDPEGEAEGFIRQFWDIFVYVVTVFLKYTWTVYIATFITTYLSGKNKIKNIFIQKYMPCVLVIEFILQSIYVRSYFEGGIILTFFLFAIQMQLLYPPNRCKRLERYFLLPGFLFGLIWIVGSNVGQRVMNMGVLIMDIWAILFLYQIVKVRNVKGKIYLYFPAYLLAIVLFCIRMFDVYRDGALSQLTCQISTGVMRGIYTEENRAIVYEKTVDIISKDTNSKDVIIVLGCNPWVYLETDAKCGAYTTWQFVEGEQVLNQYYKTFPEKIPNIIMKVPDALSVFEYWKYSSHGVGMNTVENVELNTVLTHIIEEEKYVCQEVEDVIIYRK